MLEASGRPHGSMFLEAFVGRIGNHEVAAIVRQARNHSTASRRTDLW